VRFPYNDALVMMIHIECCKVSKILVDRGSSVNILYGHALDQRENTPELAQKLVIPQSQPLLYRFNENGARSLSTVEFPFRTDPFNIVTEFCILDIQSPYKAILRRPLIHMMRIDLSTYHQLLKYPTPSGMANIRDDQAMAKIVVVIAQKRSD